MPLDDGRAEQLREGKLKARDKALRDLVAAEEAGDPDRIVDARQVVRRIQLEIERYGFDN